VSKKQDPKKLAAAVARLRALGPWSGGPVAPQSDPREAALAAISALCRGESPDPLPDHPAVRAVADLRALVATQVKDVLQSGVQRARAERAERERDAARAEAHDRGQKLDHFRAEYDAARAKVTGLEREITDLRTEIASICDWGHDPRARVADVEEENRVLREDGHRLRRIEASRGEVIAGLETRVEELVREVAAERAMSRMTDAEEARFGHQIETDRDLLRAELAKTHTKLTAERAAHEALRARVAEIEAQLAECVRSWGVTDAALDATRVQRDTATAAHEALRERVRAIRCNACEGHKSFGLSISAEGGLVRNGLYPCTDCAGTGVHPEARKALGDAEEAAHEALRGGLRAYQDIRNERAAQDAQWGGPSHDDEHDAGDWLFYVGKQLDKARSAAVRCESDKSREALVKIAALAVAAIESQDRQTSAAAASKPNTVGWGGK
jgi:hypothetical protein